ncbi:MAG: hypothetical protein SFT68_05625 [Rickettsiaceae bacterium]|nr:hypothetical protein [Rickettsiaceae bacterium]
MFLNQGINKIASIKGKTNYRPDVAWITKDGKIHVLEVKSDSDKMKDLEKRAEDTNTKLPDHLKGTHGAKTIRQLKKELGIDK